MESTAQTVAKLRILLLVIACGNSLVRSQKCSKQRWGSRYIVSNNGGSVCHWNDDFPVYGGYLNLTILSDSDCTSCSLTLQDVTVFKIIPGSCVVVSSSSSCDTTPNDGCGHVIIPMHIVRVRIKVESKNQGERLSIKFQANRCPVSETLTTSSYRNMVTSSTHTGISISSPLVTTARKIIGSTAEGIATMTSDSDPTIGRRLLIPLKPTTAKTRNVALHTTGSTEIKDPSKNVIFLIIGVAAGCTFVLGILVIVCVKLIYRSERKKSDNNRANEPITAVHYVNQQSETNHNAFESPYEMAALDPLQSPKPRSHTNDNPYTVACDESRYEIPRNLNSPTTDVASIMQRTTFQNSNLMIPEQETSTLHIYESIAQTSRNNGQQGASKTSPYVTMSLSQPESRYTAGPCVQDEYNRNCQDVYELMTPSPPVATHADNTSTNPNSAACSSVSFTFDVPTHHNNAKASTSHPPRESLPPIPLCVNQEIGSTTKSTELKTIHGNSKKLGKRDESHYVNITS